MENIDIKDFSSVSAVNDTDNILLARSGGSHGKMQVSLFKKAVIEGLSPNIRDGVWYVGDKNLNVQAEGKNPILETGTTTTLDPGSDATSEVVANGTDDAGNPKYKLNFGIPKGYDGAGGSGGGGTADSVQWSKVLNKPAWVDSPSKPTYTASEVGALPAATVIPSKTSQLTNDSGFTTSASFKTINGQSIVGSGNIAIEGGGGDTPSAGGGNVNVTNGASIETGKQYAFKPAANGSVTGTFVEVEASGSVDITDIYNRISEAVENGSISQEDFNLLKGYAESGKICVLKTDKDYAQIQLILLDNDIILYVFIPYGSDYIMYNVFDIKPNLNIQVFVLQLPAAKAVSFSLLAGYNKASAYSPISESDSISKAIGKLEYKITEESGSNDTYWLNANITNLNSSSTHEDILEALGGDVAAICDAVKAGKKIFIKYKNASFLSDTIPVSAYAVLNSVINLSFITANTGYIYAITCSTMNTSASRVKIIHPNGYTLNGSFYTLNAMSSSEEVSAAVGGETGFKAIIQAVKDGNRLVCRDETPGAELYADILCTNAILSENGDMTLAVAAVGLQAFSGVAAYAIINYIKSIENFNITVVDI